MKLFGKSFGDGLMETEYEVIIIGAGPAGLTAGIYCQRRALKTVIIERASVGGQILYASKIENYPGFGKTTGMEIAQKMDEHAKDLGVKIINEEVTGMDLIGNVKKIMTHENTYTTNSVIVATGGEHRKLDVKGEKEFIGKGVSYCTTCDGPLFKDRIVAVVGGNNMAVTDALYLSDIAKKVYLIHRGDLLKAEEIEQEKLKRKNIEVILNTTVEGIVGDKMVKSIKIKNLSGEVKNIKVDGIFVSIGIVPSIEIAKKAGIKVDDKNFIIVDREQRTNVDGVFAAGDVTGGARQISTAVGEGCTAALSAYKYVRKIN